MPTWMVCTPLDIRELWRLISYFVEVGIAYHQGQTIKAREIIGSALDPSAQVASTILTVKELLAPLAREEVKLVRCLGLNYADHAVCLYNVPPYRICALITTST